MCYIKINILDLGKFQYEETEKRKPSLQSLTALKLIEKGKGEL